MEKQWKDMTDIWDRHLIFNLEWIKKFEALNAMEAFEWSVLLENHEKY